MPAAERMLSGVLRRRPQFDNSCRAGLKVVLSIALPSKYLDNLYEKPAEECTVDSGLDQHLTGWAHGLHSIFLKAAVWKWYLYRISRKLSVHFSRPFPF